MSIWWTSDQHFGHANIIKYCNRPFIDVDEMDDAMHKRWNVVVQPDDVVIVVGDFSFHGEYETTAILAGLHGKKILIRGNHDKRKTDTYWERVGFSAIDTQMIVSLDEVGPVLVRHAPRNYSEVGNVLPNVQVHGHVHDRYKTHTWKTVQHYFVNVGVDQWGFAPVSTPELIKTILGVRHADIYSSRKV